MSETLTEVEEFATNAAGVPLLPHRPKGAAGAESGYGNFAYERSSLSGSIIEQDAKENPDALFNARDPYYAILHEKPEHRVIIQLKLRGMSQRQIASVTGYTALHVSNILRQPWARERITRELRNAGIDDVRDMVANAAAASVFTLIEIRDDQNAPAAVRSATARSLLEQYLGKPKQAIEHSGTIDMNKLTDAQLAAMLPPTDGTGNSEPSGSLSLLKATPELAPLCACVGARETAGPQ